MPAFCETPNANTSGTPSTTSGQLERTSVSANLSAKILRGLMVKDKRNRKSAD